MSGHKFVHAEGGIDNPPHAVPRAYVSGDRVRVLESSPEEALRGRWGTVYGFAGGTSAAPAIVRFVDERGYSDSHHQIPAADLEPLPVFKAGDTVRVLESYAGSALQGRTGKVLARSAEPEELYAIVQFAYGTSAPLLDAELELVQ